jgi:hypothetical protein
VFGPVVTGVAVLALATSASVLTTAGSAAATSPISVGPISTVSVPCTGQNAEVEQAVDPSGDGYVYEAWTGCGGIGFARSTDSGASFSPAVTLPGSTGSPGDPDVAVAPDGTVYIVFMMLQNGQNYPVVDASSDHGATFPQVTSLIPPDPLNWGDSPNIAVGPDGTVYVTWDFGPQSSSVVWRCSLVGSCSYTAGDLNVVVQKSTDGAKSFGPIIPISPGYPYSGADNAPIVVDPAGHLDVLFQDYPTSGKKHTLSPAANYFTTSDDEGTTWSTPVAVGAAVGTMSTTEWWNQPGIGIDAGGNLYAAWDTQGKAANGARTDTGWLSYSVDGGATWSAPVQAPSDQKNVPHIMEVTGGRAGEAYVGWLSDSNHLGYALYLRSFSIDDGWLDTPQQISKIFGLRTVWPGDTFGLSTLGPDQIMTSWGSAAPTSAGQSAVYAAAVSTT